jgi:hypothetical protein
LLNVKLAVYKDGIQTEEAILETDDFEEYKFHKSTGRTKHLQNLLLYCHL